MAEHRYAAHEGMLSRLDQRRVDGNAVDHLQLQRQGISADDQGLIDTQWRKICPALMLCLADSANWEVVGATRDDFVDRCRSWIKLVGDDLKIAQNPNVA